MGFSAYSTIKRGEGKELLRAKQFQIAMEGDKTMLVWLGKQYLDQSDHSAIDHNVNLPTLPTIQIRTKNGSD